MGCIYQLIIDVTCHGVNTFNELAGLNFYSWNYCPFACNISSDLLQHSARRLGAYPGIHGVGATVMAAADGKLARRLIDVVFRMEIATLRQQHHTDIGVANVGRQVQRTPFIIIQHMDIGAVLDQVLTDVGMPIPGHLVQQTPTLLIHRMKIGAALEQVLIGIDITPCDRLEQLPI